ncbi:MAG TPA: hypothetical protein VGI79_21750 [Caulobacteraceae bacterium]|jgi:hypothetical protein
MSSRRWFEDFQNSELHHNEGGWPREMIIGDPSSIALEAGITEAFEQPSQLALGYFAIHICGKVFGVRSHDATMLACSYNAMKARLDRRGNHAVRDAKDRAALEIVRHCQAAIYGIEHNATLLSADEAFGGRLMASNIVWAPDGDAAFDDGGHVLQFDEGNEVRLIAFKNEIDFQAVISSVAEAWVPTAIFYELLAEWLRWFDSERHVGLGLRTRH